MAKQIEPQPEQKSQLTQFNETSLEYEQLSETDPIKTYAQYPEALRLLGEVKGESILDIGCGNGVLDRLLAKNGAKVTAYDPSENMIAIAQGLESQQHLGIRYFVGDSPASLGQESFDKAVSTMVLLLAENQEALKQTFSNAFRFLKENGIFVSVTLNPDFEKDGRNVYGRRLTLPEKGKGRSEFLSPDGSVNFSADWSDFSVDDYEKAAKESGFKKVEWQSMHPNTEGREKMGNDFWAEFENNGPWIALVAAKQKYWVS